MADELSLTVRLNFKKGSPPLEYKVSRTENITVDVAGDAFSHEIQSIPTSNTALTEGVAVGTPGYYFIKNLDASNFITVGLTGSYAIKLLAGEVCLFRAAGAIYALADTAACLIEFVLIEL